MAVRAGMAVPCAMAVPRATAGPAAARRRHGVARAPGAAGAARAGSGLGQPEPGQDRRGVLLAGKAGAALPRGLAAADRRPARGRVSRRPWASQASHEHPAGVQALSQAGTRPFLAGPRTPARGHPGERRAIHLESTRWSGPVPADGAGVLRDRASAARRHAGQRPPGPAHGPGRGYPRRACAGLPEAGGPLHPRTAGTARAVWTRRLGRTRRPAGSPGRPPDPLRSAPRPSWSHALRDAPGPGARPCSRPRELHPA
jgi:hypothetical protein